MISKVFFFISCCSLSYLLLDYRQMCLCLSVTVSTKPSVACLWCGVVVMRLHCFAFIVSLNFLYTVRSLFLLLSLSSSFFYFSFLLSHSFYFSPFLFNSLYALDIVMIPFVPLLSLSVSLFCLSLSMCLSYMQRDRNMCPIQITYSKTPFLSFSLSFSPPPVIAAHLSMLQKAGGRKSCETQTGT